MDGLYFSLQRAGEKNRNPTVSPWKRGSYSARRLDGTA
jgi:hypothetical protein